MQVSNFCTLQKSLLGQNMQSLEQTAEAMRKRLEVTVRKFDDVKIQANDIVETVTFQASKADGQYKMFRM